MIMLRLLGQLVNFDKSAICVSPIVGGNEGRRLAAIFRSAIG